MRTLKLRQARIEYFYMRIFENFKIQVPTWFKRITYILKSNFKKKFV